METGYWIGGIACAAYGLFCAGIGIFRPKSLIRLVKRKLKVFTGGKESGDRAAIITSGIFGGIGLAAAAAVFIIGALNA